MKILIGTKNPCKIQGAKEALENYFDSFDIEGIPVSSDVSEEPVNNDRNDNDHYKTEDKRREVFILDHVV